LRSAPGSSIGLEIKAQREDVFSPKKVKEPSPKSLTHLQRHLKRRSLLWPFKGLGFGVFDLKRSS
jgi:hypothetical protein